MAMYGGHTCWGRSGAGPWPGGGRTGGKAGCLPLSPPTCLIFRCLIQALWPCLGR